MFGFLHTSHLTLSSAKTTLADNIENDHLNSSQKRQEYCLTRAKFIFSTNTHFHFMAHFRAYLPFPVTSHFPPPTPMHPDCPVLPLPIQTSQLTRIHTVDTDKTLVCLKIWTLQVYRSCSQFAKSKAVISSN